MKMAEVIPRTRREPGEGQRYLRRKPKNTRPESSHMPMKRNCSQLTPGR